MQSRDTADTAMARPYSTLAGHSNKALIDEALDRGDSVRSIAKQFGLPSVSAVEQEDENDPDAFRPATSAEADCLKAALTLAGYSTITPDPIGDGRFRR